MVSVITADALALGTALWFPDYRFIRSAYNIRRADLSDAADITESELDEEEIDEILFRDDDSGPSRVTPVDPSTYIALVAIRDALDANEEDREAVVEISPFLLCRIKAAIRDLSPQMAIYLNPCAAAA